MREEDLGNMIQATLKSLIRNLAELGPRKRGTPGRAAARERTLADSVMIVGLMDGHNQDGRLLAIATTQMQIEGYFISAYKGTACGETYVALLRDAEALGGIAVLNACFDDTLDVETLYHGAAVVIRPLIEVPPVAAGITCFAATLGSGVRIPPSPPEYPRVFEVEGDFSVQSERRSPANRRARIACRRASVRGRPASRTCVRRGRELR